jgi:hypothetical protein
LLPPVTIIRFVACGHAPCRYAQSGEAHAYEIHQFCLQLVLNHTIVIETLRDKVGAGDVHC